MKFFEKGGNKTEDVESGNDSLSEVVEFLQSLHPDTGVGVEHNKDEGVYEFGWYRPNGKFEPINAYKTKESAEDFEADVRAEMHDYPDTESPEETDPDSEDEL